MATPLFCGGDRGDVEESRMAGKAGVVGEARMSGEVGEDRMSDEVGEIECLAR